jgi:hypothetical protein
VSRSSHLCDCRSQVQTLLRFCPFVSDIQRSHVGVLQSLNFDSVALNTLSVDHHKHKIILSYHFVDLNWLVFRIKKNEISDLIPFAIKHTYVLAVRNDCKMRNDSSVLRPKLLNCNHRENTSFGYWLYYAPCNNLTSE